MWSRFTSFMSGSGKNSRSNERLATNENREANVVSANNNNQYVRPVVTGRPYTIPVAAPNVQYNPSNYYPTYSNDNQIAPENNRQHFQTNQGTPYGTPYRQDDQYRCDTPYPQQGIFGSSGFPSRTPNPVPFSAPNKPHVPQNYTTSNIQETVPVTHSNPDQIAYGTQTELYGSYLAESLKADNVTRPKTNIEQTTKPKRNVKHYPSKAPKYKGEEQCWEAFIMEFENAAEANEWNDTDKLVYLKTSLQGEATITLKEQSKWTFDKLVIALKENNTGKISKTRLLSRLNSIRQKSNQTIQSLRQEMLHVMMQLDEGDCSELFVITLFKDALLKSEIRHYLNQMKPKTFQEAVGLALEEDENLRDDAHKMKQARISQLTTKEETTETSKTPNNPPSKTMSPIKQTEGYDKEYIQILEEKSRVLEGVVNDLRYQMDNASMHQQGSYEVQNYLNQEQRNYQRQNSFRGNDRGRSNRYRGNNRGRGYDRNNFNSSGESSNNYSSDSSNSMNTRSGNSTDSSTY